MPAAYIVVTMDITDEELFAQYLQGAAASLSEHGAKILSATDKIDLLEGVRPAQRFVLLEFESEQAARGWYESPNYQKIVNLRMQSTSTKSAMLCPGTGLA